jgi:hypothetical protein
MATTNPPIGTYARALHASRVVQIRFNNATDFPDFDNSPINTATITQDGALTIGAADFSTTENVVRFRISGGAVGRVRVSVSVENALGDKDCQSLIVETRNC